jgi:hypothetical protein
MGRIWQQIDLPASSINALTIRQDQNVLLTATENGVFASSNSGEQWEHLINVSAALCVTCCESETLAGMLDHGIWISSPGRDSQPAADLANRTLLGMLLSDFFDQDGTGFLYGPGEGIWKTHDGGASWERLEQIPPHLEIAQLAIHASPGSTHLLVAASTGGVLRSVDAGKHWEVCSEEPADQIVLSPDGKILAANFPRQGLHVSRDQGTTWQDVPGPWDASGKILALRVSNLGQYYIAFLEGSEETISLWQGLPGCFEQILAHPCGSNSMVSLSISPDASPDQPWYMALGASVWRFCTHPNEPGVVKEILPELPAGTTIFSLVVENEKGRPLLLLSSGQQIFLSRGGEPWRMTHDLGQERALKIVLPRSGSAQGIAYVLLLGGSLCRIDLPVTDL